MRTLMAVFLSFLIATNAVASPDSDRVGRRAAGDGIRAGVQWGAREYMNNHIQHLPGIGSVSNVGGNVMLGVGLFMSGKEFGEAKDDKGRGFAVADGVVSVIAVGNPVAGLIAAGVVLAVKLLDGMLSAGAMKDLLAIYERIARQYERIAELNKLGADSEAQIVFAAESRINEAGADLNRSLDYAQTNCYDSKGLTSFENVDKCLANAMQIVADFQILIGQTEVLANFHSAYFPVDDEFKREGTTRQKFAQNAIAERQAFAEYQTNIENVRNLLKSAWLELIRVKAEQNAFGDMEEALRNTCIQAAMDLRQSSIDARIARLSGSDLEKLSIDKVTVAVIYDQMRDFSTGECVELSRVSKDKMFKSNIEEFSDEFNHFRRVMSL